VVTFDAYICGMIIWLLLQYSPFPKDGVFSLAGSGRTLVRRHHVRAGFFILQFFCWSIVGVKIPLGDFQIRWTLVRTHQKKTPSLGGGKENTVVIVLYVRDVGKKNSLWFLYTFSFYLKITNALFSFKISLGPRICLGEQIGYAVTGESHIWMYKRKLK